MKKALFAIAGAALLGFSFSAPADALPMRGIAKSDVSGVELVQHRRGNSHRHHHVKPRKICRMERIVKRGHHGRRIVQTVRVCR